jgi:hypothetical protein
MATKLQKDSEFVCLLEDGSVSDFWLHEAILAGGEAASSKRAIAAAIRRGMASEDAEEVYGIATKPDTVAVDFDPTGPARPAD